MCGIIGCDYEDRRFIKKGLAATAHRGPDATGTYFDKNVSLGHNRLSIVDLSPSGKQPMSNESGTVWIVFNGEIYNHKALRQTLQKQHTFQSSSDTEVMIHLYEEKGISFVNQLQGMFAFCIYDQKKKKLYLARDRVGIKPLYYTLKNNKFIFCSEIKGILESGELQARLHKESISPYLTFRANTSNATLFEDIQKLPPAHYAEYDLITKKMTLQRFWDVNYSPVQKSESYFIKKLQALLDDSIHARLMSDVPYGAYLSGGVDSGTVVSYMAKHAPQAVKTFSVGFEEESDGEVLAAKELAEKIGADHHELLISSKSIRHLPNIVWHADEPMCDPTVIPTYLLSQYTKKYCTVVLTGEGADEVFGGYPQYRFMKMKAYSSVPPLTHLSHLGPKIAKNLPQTLLNKGFKFAGALGKKGLDRFDDFVHSKKPEEQHLSQISIFNENEQSELLGKRVDLYRKYSKYYTHTSKKNIVSSAMMLEFKEGMVEDLLMKVDKNTMAFAIEGRVPFLDYRVVEFGATVPEQLKLKGFTKDKYLLRKAVGSLVPKPTQQRKKRHFFVPIDHWLNDELSTLKNELLSDTYLREQGIFKPEYIHKMNAGLDQSKLFYMRQLWSLLVFQIWYKEFIEHEKVKI